MQSSKVTQKQNNQNHPGQVQKGQPNAQNPPPTQNQNPLQQNIPQNERVHINQATKMTPQQQALLQNFFKLTYQFIPPPIITDINTTAYRENFQSFIQSNSSIYQMFQKKYFISNGKQVPPPGLSQPQNQAAREPNSNTPLSTEQLIAKVQSNYNQSIKIKVYNLKFSGYTLFASMTEALKHLSALNLNTERIKQIQTLLAQKIHKFYQLSEELKEDYRRYFILYKLENQIAFLQKQTNIINQKLKQISDYVSSNVNTSQIQEQPIRKESSD